MEMLFVDAEPTVIGELAALRVTADGPIGWRGRIRFEVRGPRDGVVRGRFVPRAPELTDGRAVAEFYPSRRLPRTVKVYAWSSTVHTP